MIGLRRVTLLVFLVVVSTASSFGQRIFLVSRSTDAEVTVFVSRSIKKADLLVYRVKYQHDAKENQGLWYTALHSKLADKKVYFTDRAESADIKIFYVSDEKNAGWRNRLKKHFFE